MTDIIPLRPSVPGRGHAAAKKSPRGTPGIEIAEGIWNHLGAQQTREYAAITAAVESISGLLLAGGAGRRVGGCDKGLLPYRGRTLVDHVVQRFAPQVGQLLLSCNRNESRYRAFCDNLVMDRRPGFPGPLAGLEAATPLVEGEWLAIAPCDVPQLPRDLVARLLSAATDAPADLAYAHDGQRAQYLCALMRRQCLQTLPAYLNRGERSVKGWYAGLRCVAVDFSQSPEAFENINRGLA